MRHSFSLKTSVVALSVFILAACNDSGFQFPEEPVVITPPPPPATLTFQVKVSDLTNGQPLSPAAIIAHTSDYSVFTLGAAASSGLEVLAEGGDNTDLIAEADGNAAVFATASGAAPIGPGASETITIEILETELPDALLSVSTMLVNTNDAITGVNKISLADLAVGDTVTRRGVAYDAGTEANTKLAAEIPGPAGGGEGFDAARDDRIDAVSMHSGVVTAHDGLSTSGLNGQHRFDNPVIAVSIERIN